MALHYNQFGRTYSEEKMESLRICCVCSEKNRKLISPDTMFPGIKVTIRKMLDDLVHPALYSTRATLPNRVCLQCVNKLENAYVLKMTFKESIVHFAKKRNIDAMNSTTIDDDIRKMENKTAANVANNATKEIIGNVYHRRKFQCKICHRRYRLKGEWKTHQERHALKKKQFKCYMCGLIFLTQKHKITHLCQRKKEGLSNVKHK